MIDKPADIWVGRQMKAELLKEKFDVGSYKCTNIATGEISYVIAPALGRKNWHEYRPTSAICPFESAEEAVRTLNRWASDPTPPPSPKSPRPLDGRRNEKNEPGQLNLNL
jgi:hypothetical protein